MADEKIFQNLRLDLVSANVGGLQIVGGTAAYLSTQQCRSCLVACASNAAAFVNFNAAATATCLVLRQDYLPLPIPNLSIINVYAAAAVTVYVIWRD